MCFRRINRSAVVASSLQPSYVRRPVPAWRQLLASPDFQLIAAVNAVIFTTNNGGRSVLMPLLAKEHLAMKTSTLGAKCPISKP
jgi:hypothetical protein